jgi:uncharacterized protein (TIGR03086 family)
MHKQEPAHMTATELYLYAVDQATTVVTQVGPEQFELPTPCTEWNVRALVNHMLYELAWADDLSMGKTIQEVGDAYDGDLVGEDLQRSWREYELATRQSVSAAEPTRVAHLSYGDRPLSEYLLEAGNDQLVHAWDLGQAIGIEVVFDEQVAEELYKRAQENQQANEGSGLFAAAVPVSASASTQTKLLALQGRSANWHRAS